MNPLLIKYAIAAAGVAVFGWLCYDYGHDSVMSEWQIERAEVANATSTAIIMMREQQDAIRIKLEQKESKSWELYQDAETKANDLIDELNDRPWRVRIEARPADCPVSESDSASKLGDDSAVEYAELPAETTRSVIKIGRDADRCEAKLSALQEYIKVILDAK